VWHQCINYVSFDSLIDLWVQKTRSAPHTTDDTRRPCVYDHGCFISHNNIITLIGHVGYFQLGHFCPHRNGQRESYPHLIAIAIARYTGAAEVGVVGFAEKTSWKKSIVNLFVVQGKYYSFAKKVCLKRQADKAAANQRQGKRRTSSVQCSKRMEF